MKIILYRDIAGEWRWHLRARNGRIIADSGEGYKERRKCMEAIWKLFRPTLVETTYVYIK